MNTPKRVAVVIVAVTAIICVALLFELSDRAYLRRSPVGHLIRWAHGETGAQQTVNDLADDLRGQSFLDQVQQWSVETMGRFDSGNIATNSGGPNWPIHAVVLASNQIPNFVRQIRPNEAPEVAIGVSTNAHAECVIIDWYLYGLVLGPTNRGQSFFKLYDDLANEPIIPLYIVGVRPGVFVIWYDSK